MAKALMVTGPGGSKYLFPCCRPEEAIGVLNAAVASGHHAVISHPGTRVEYGDDSGDKWTCEKVIREGAKREVPEPPVPLASD